MEYSAARKTFKTKIFFLKNQVGFLLKQFKIILKSVACPSIYFFLCSGLLVVAGMCVRLLDVLTSAGLVATVCWKC
jgi:hypothetical protein